VKLIVVGLIAALIAAPGMAQPAPGANGAVAMYGGALPEVEQPPRKFATAEEHYNYLLKQANGCTKHTMQTIPQWSGLWTSGRNSMVGIFMEGGTMGGLGAGGTVKKGVLSPAYEKQFLERRAEMVKVGEQPFDRLANCEYPGVPRWLWEP